MVSELLPGLGMTPISDGMATLAREVRQALDGVRRGPEAAAEITRALKRALAQEDLIAEELLEPSFSSYRQQILYRDPQGDFSIAALIWLPGQVTPIHDHRCWCCFGVWRGRELETNYRRSSWGLLEPDGKQLCYPGEVEFLVPPGDVHQVSNDDTESTVSVHIYGVDLGVAGTSVHRRYEEDGSLLARSWEGGVQTLAVVGGGFSGTLTAVHLLRKSGEDAAIILYEPSAGAGRGIAYGTQCPAHLLNVPAGGMSALPDEPLHFYDWCRARGHEVSPGDFLPRSWYGEYLGEVLAQAVENSAARFELRQEQVVSLAKEEAGIVIAAADGSRQEVDAVVLAIGSPPGRGRLPLSRDQDTSHWPEMIDPWKANALAAIQPQDDVLVVGTGLTCMDVVAELASQGHCGEIWALSRRGLLPAAHQAPQPGGFDLEAFRARLVEQPMRVRLLCQFLRREVAAAQAQGTDWRELIQAMRPLTTKLWAALPRAERRRFARHLRPYWEILRHRVAPCVRASFDELRGSGQLNLRRGSLRSLTRAADGRLEALLRSPGGTEEVYRVNQVVNATGFSGRLASSSSDLLRNLHQQGWIREDDLGLGVEVSSDFRLVDRDDEVLDGVYYIGPMLRARFWECTAVPELRARASEVANTVLAAVAVR